MEVAAKVFHVLQPRQSGAGKATEGKNSSNSASGIVSTLIPTLLTFLAFITLFLIFRRKYHRVYTPRATTSVVRRRNRTTADQQKRGLLGWITEFRALPDEFVLRHNSFDGYLWLRYLKMLIMMCFVGCCLTWPILFPVNATGPGGQHQLDVLNYSNSAGSPNRYYAHALVSWVFLGFVMILVARERVYFIGLRQAYYLHPFNAARLSSRTVLFLSVPNDKLSETALRRLFGSAVRKIWFAPDCKKLEKSVEDRDKLANKLEAAQIKLISASLKKESKSKSDTEKRQTSSNDQDASRYFEKKDRPTHKLKFLIGKKVDTMDYAHEHLPELEREIETSREKSLGEGATKTTAVFIEFSTQSAAQKALQTVALKPRTQMSPRYIGVQPDQVVWKNLGMSKSMRTMRNALATTFVVLLTMFWTIPIAIVGAISNINYLTTKVPFLGFINSIPKVILGVVTGLLPVVLLAVVIALVPVLMRFLAKLFEPTEARVELKQQSYYFIFQVIQVFLVMTFASGASSVAGQIVQNPSLALTLLAENLPKASNFYINYFILQGLSIAGATLLSIGSLAMLVFIGKFLDKTPRKQYNRWINLGGLGWGAIFPKYTNLGVIAISYSCIAPLILGFAMVGFFLLYIAFRYNEMFVLGNKVDTKGACYSRALQQLLTGVYLSAICLAGLFGISKSWGPLALEIIFIVAAVVFHISMDMILKPLEATLPLDMQTGDDRDMSRLTAMEEGDGLQEGKGDVRSSGRQGEGTDGSIPMRNIQTNGQQHGYPQADSNIPIHGQMHGQQQGYPQQGGNAPLTSSRVSGKNWQIADGNIPSTAPQVNGQHQRNSDAYDQSETEYDHNSEHHINTRDNAPNQSSAQKLGFKQKMQRKILPQMTSSESAPSSPPPKANMITRFLKPHIYASGSALRPLIEDSAKPTDANLPKYGEDAMHGAYVNPALTSPMPVIWLAQDRLGMSKMFISDNRKARLESTDDGAVFSEKNKAVWDPPAPLDSNDIAEEEAESRWQEKVPIWRREADY